MVPIPGEDFGTNLQQSIPRCSWKTEFAYCHEHTSLFNIVVVILLGLEYFYFPLFAEVAFDLNFVTTNTLWSLMEKYQKVKHQPSSSLSFCSNFLSFPPNSSYSSSNFIFKSRKLNRKSQKIVRS